MSEKKPSLILLSNKGRKDWIFPSKKKFAFTSNYNSAMFFLIQEYRDSDFRL